MNIFLDANILVSVVNKEYPLYNCSARLLSLPQPRFRIHTSALCLAITFCFASKKYGAKKSKGYIELLTKKIFITACGEAEVLQATQNKKVNDLEDGVQYYSALRSGCTCIVTEDVKDYYFSDIDVFNCTSFLEKHFSKS